MHCKVCIVNQRSTLLEREKDGATLSLFGFYCSCRWSDYTFYIFFNIIIQNLDSFLSTRYFNMEKPKKKNNSNGNQHNNAHGNKKGADGSQQKRKLSMVEMIARGQTPTIYPNSGKGQQSFFFFFFNRLLV